MTQGSGIQEDVSRHFGSCALCKATRPEEVRVAQPGGLRRTVPESVLAAMCPAGRAIYRAYLRWLAEPDA